MWNARPENRQLPSLLQWLQIRWLTTKKNWTPPQRKMMRKAGRYHAVRGATSAIVLMAVCFGYLALATNMAEHEQANQANYLVSRLLEGHGANAGDHS